MIYNYNVVYRVIQMTSNCIEQHKTKLFYQHRYVEINSQCTMIHCNIVMQKTLTPDKNFPSGILEDIQPSAHLKRRTLNQQNETMMLYAFHPTENQYSDLLSIKYPVDIWNKIPGVAVDPCKAIANNGDQNNKAYPCLANVTLPRDRCFSPSRP